MKPHLLRIAVGILTFIIGWSIPSVILKRTGETVAPAGTLTQVSSAWTILLSFQGRDLTEIYGQQKAQLDTAIESLRTRKENEFLVPRLFSKVSTSKGEQRYVLIEESPLRMIPGDSRLRISLFNATGQLLSSSEFAAGWRIHLTEIRFVQVKDISGDILEVESYQSIGGADVAWQYYALVGDEMRLIRLEDSSRALTPNRYSTPNHTIGATQTCRSAADLQTALVSDDVAEVLATLTWLSGGHWNLKDGNEPAYWHEEPSQARLVEAVRASPAVKEAVDVLKRSDISWVREAATSAAERMR
jgi:hypothetical protein